MPEQISSYRLENEIARGGMGIVYRGVHMVFEEVVAIKAIYRELMVNPDIRQRFLNEARIQRRLQHPNAHIRARQRRRHAPRSAPAHHAARGVTTIIPTAHAMSLTNLETGHHMITIQAHAVTGRGQIHPRAVGLHNTVHRFWGPIALAALAGLGVLSVGFLIGALTWAFHIALDRALGYGLRSGDGHQRP